MSTKYSIGDELWRATFDMEPAYVTCPDCGGTRFMTIKLFDGTEHTVDCRTCESVYHGPQGTLKVYDRKPTATPLVVTQIEVERDGTKYNYCPEGDLFRDEAGALVRAQEMADQFSKDERDRILSREKDTKSWAWNATYHRRCIKDAQKSLEYHTAKLSVASARAKGAKP